MSRTRERDDNASSSGNVALSSTTGSGRKRYKNAATKPPNPVTVEKLRMIVEQEGRSARNLVSWSIPVDTHVSNKARSNAKHRRAGNATKRAQSCESGLRKIAEATKDNDEDRSSSGERKSKILPRQPSTRGTKKPISIRARYWAYLFENLRRAVDEIYTTCEGDANVMECKEMLLVLDNYRHDFHALIDWINLQERLENANDRPTSLAWEVRKSSPGRPRQKAAARVPPASTAAQSSNRINSKSAPDAVGKSTVQQGTMTWADKVKGITVAPTAGTTSNTSSRPIIDQKQEDVSASDGADDDGGGWETVSGKPRQTKHAKNQKTDSKVSRSTSANSTPRDARLKSKPTNEVPDTSAGYVNLVVDRIIGSAGSSSKSPTSPSDGKPVEFAASCRELENNKAVRNQVKQLTFEGELTNDKDGALADLDAAEVEFFKAVAKENNLQKGDELADECTPSDCDKSTDIDDSGGFEQLKALKRQEASLAETLRAEHDTSIAAAEQQERHLRRQLQEVEESKAEGQDTPEMDIERTRNSFGTKEPSLKDKPTPNGPLEWSEFLARFDEHKGASWGDMVEEEELREPGRAGQMHEKLSSPSRRRTPAESKRKLEEKHRRAEERRIRMNLEKSHRVRELTEKVQEVVNWKNDLIRRQCCLLQSYHAEKLARAEEQRAMQLLNIKRKAQAEETKVSEIAFINELQEQNKRHEVLMRIGEHETRIQEMEQERSKWLEMKSVKEENFKERRRALEKERQERIEELKEKRKEHDARVEQQRIEKEKEREKISKERARERELRLSARNAAQQEAVCELQKKIQLKHDESERRHQEQLEQRKEKAVELSLGRFSTSCPTPTTSITPIGLMKTGMTPNDGDAQPETVQNFEEKSHNVTFADKPNPFAVDGKGDIAEQQVFFSGSSTNSPRSIVDENKTLKENALEMKERKKMMKKRAKKIRLRMTSRAKDFLKRVEMKNGTVVPAAKSKLVRLIKEAHRQLTSQKDNTGSWPSNRVNSLDRFLGEIIRVLEKQNEGDQSAFRSVGGFDMLEEIFEILIREDANSEFRPPDAPGIFRDRLISNAASVFRLACCGNHDNCVYAAYSNRLTPLIDVLLRQISKNEIEESNKSPAPVRASSVSNPSKKSPSARCPAKSMDHFDPASPSLLRALADTLRTLSNKPVQEPASSKIDASSFLLMIPGNGIDQRQVVDAYLNRGLDVISYVVASGLLDLLSEYLSNVRHEVAPGSNLAAFVENGLACLESITSFVSMRNRFLSENHSNPGKTSSGHTKKQQTGPGRDNSASRAQWEADPTQLLPTLQLTELMGIVSVLYGLLLHGAPERPTTMRSAKVNKQTTGQDSSKQIPEHTLSVALAVMRVLNAVAQMDLRLLQASLGAEGVSLEFRHICTYLLWYCVRNEQTELLHEVILAVGHFTLGNRRNQNIVDSGAQPSVLQQLCLLPFTYFSSPKPMLILLPTLIACCYDNMANLAIMEREASGSFLACFIQTIIDERIRKVESASVPAKKKKSAVVEESSQNNFLLENPFFTTEFLKDALRFFGSSMNVAET